MDGLASGIASLLMVMSIFGGNPASASDSNETVRLETIEVGPSDADLDETLGNASKLLGRVEDAEKSADEAFSAMGSPEKDVENALKEAEDLKKLMRNYR